LFVHVMVPTLFPLTNPHPVTRNLMPLATLTTDFRHHFFPLFTELGTSFLLSGLGWDMSHSCELNPIRIPLTAIPTILSHSDCALFHKGDLSAPGVHTPFSPGKPFTIALKKGAAFCPLNSLYHSRNHRKRFDSFFFPAKPTPEPRLPPLKGVTKR